MTKLLTSNGGTRAWRRVVTAVLARDGYTCRMARDGQVCGRPATTANHRIARVHGGGHDMGNLEAACVPCNMGAGARLRGAAGALVVARHNAVIAAVAVLDRIGAPCTGTVADAARLLATHSAHPWVRDDLIAAVRHRRARGPLERI